MAGPGNRPEALAAVAAGIYAWIDAARGLRENPVYRIGQRSGSYRDKEPQLPGQRLRTVLLAALPWSVLLLVIESVTVRLAQHQRPGDPAALGLGMLAGLVGLYLIWCGSGIYQTALYVMDLLAPTEGKPVKASWLDESVQGSRVSDHEILVAILALALPRIWLRWFLAPAALLGSFVLWAAFNCDPETLQSRAYFVSDNPGWLMEMVKLAPLTILWLLGTGLISSLVMLLWLISLARSDSLAWRRNLVAFSVSVAQPAWLVVGLWQMFDWRQLNTTTVIDWTPRVFSPFIALVLLCATLQFGKCRSELRNWLAALAPPLLIALGITGTITAMQSTAGAVYTYYNWFHDFAWSLSWLGLVNPHAVPSPSSFGLGQNGRFMYASLELFRLPVLVLLQVIGLAICAFAARLAVIDWRYSED